MTEPLLTTGQVAKQLGKSTDRIRQLERSGKLPAQKLAGGQRLFRLEDVERFAKLLSSQK